jgi:hypothetical protein
MIDTWLIMLTVLLLSSLLLVCYPCRSTLKADHLLVQPGALR